MQSGIAQWYVRYLNVSACTVGVGGLHALGDAACREGGLLSMMLHYAGA